jgi:rod shape determining protein RodA
MRFRENRFVKHIDFRIIIAALMLIAVGLVLLRSTPGSDKRVTKQIVFACIGFAAMLATLYLDYDLLTNIYEVVFAANIVVLVLVLLLAPRINGAYSWIKVPFIGTVQPSEFAKLVLIATLSVYVAQRNAHVRDPFFFVVSFVQVAAPPMFLILLQHDLGTAIVCFVIWTGIMLAAGCSLEHMALVWIGGLAAFGALWKRGWLPDEHVARITYWLHPEAGAQTDGYQYIVTEAAIGSGGVWGAGFGNGPMTQNARVPEQQTDMIFSVLGEEWGLVGCTIVLLLFLFIMWRGISTMQSAKNDLGRYVAAGVVSMLVCHVVVNIGMQTRLCPITGIPLPLMSAGGSSLISCMIGIGLLVNVHMRRRKITF